MPVTFKFDSVSELMVEASKPARIPSNDWLDRDPAQWGRGGLCSDRPDINTQAAIRDAMAAPLFPAGVARIERLSKLINAPTPVSVRRVAKRRAEGDELDMQRVWQGDLDHAWRRMEREARVGPARVLIAVDASVAGGAHADVLAWRGVAALALAEALYGAGHSVQIDSVHTSMTACEPRDRFRCDVTVMAAGEHLDTHKAASLLASSLLARGVLYNLQLKTAPGVVSTAIGSVGRVSESELAANTFDYVAIAGHEIINQRAAQAWIETHIAALDARANGELPSVAT